MRALTLFFVSLMISYNALTFAVSDGKKHKFYLSVSKVNYNEKEQAFEMVSRVFIDDLELALSTRYGQSVGLDTEEEQVEVARTLITRYLNSMLELQVNDAAVPMEFIGYTYEADQIILLIAFKPSKLSGESRIDFRNRLLTDVFEEQQNLVHFSIQKQKKSEVLSREKDRFEWSMVTLK
ncbi:MAG: hypothetical protein RLZZ242_292 [Bacteroidota bacterium]|jgi:hypothetical protein